MCRPGSGAGAHDACGLQPRVGIGCRDATSCCFRFADTSGNWSLLPAWIFGRGNCSVFAQGNRFAGRQASCGKNATSHAIGQYAFDRVSAWKGEKQNKRSIGSKGMAIACARTIRTTSRVYSWVRVAREFEFAICDGRDIVVATRSDDAFGDMCGDGFAESSPHRSKEQSAGRYRYGRVDSGWHRSGITEGETW